MCLANIDIVILCGGLGTRIAPVLGDTPKILAPLGGVTMLEHLLCQLDAYGARRAILAAGHGSDKLKKWIVDRTARTIELSLAVEPMPCGTAKALRFVYDRLRGGLTLVINGDTLLDFDVCRFVGLHKQRHAVASALTANSEPEKFCGYFMVSAWAMQKILRCGETDLERAIGLVVDEKHPLNLVVGDFDFVDIGTPQGYARARERFDHQQDAVPR